MAEADDCVRRSVAEVRGVNDLAANLPQGLGDGVVIVVSFMEAVTVPAVASHPA